MSYWNSGDVLQNIVRGTIAEWLVHHALGVDPGKYRDPWADIDVAFTGAGLEVKAVLISASYRLAAISIERLIDRYR